VVTPRVLDVNQLIVEIGRMLQRIVGEDIVLTTTLSPRVRPIEIDPSAMTQVLMNLACNARDAMPTGGTLTIATADAEHDGRHWVRLTVTDTGAGIPASARGRVFEPFFTTKPAGKGTGLGLAVVHGIVEQGGGRIDVESAPGEGSIFVIDLPVTEERRARRATAERTALDRGSESVLLVEDDEQVRRMAIRALRRHGYQAEPAGDADEALQILANRSFDLMITDVVMPGMNGRELADKVRQQRPSIKVIFTSGYTDDAVLRRGVQTDEVEFLPKPYTTQALIGRVRRVLDAHER
jgi:two-component system, cell cycle sensor histidine kinase and response regulator CckA